jgi:energy-coupling factor transport system permease protein
VDRPAAPGGWLVTVHPGAWAVWATSAAAVTFATTNPFYLLPLAIAAWAVHLGHRAEHPAARSFAVFVWFAAGAVLVRTALVMVGPVEPGSVASAALEGLRLGVLLIVFGAFNSVTDPFSWLRLAPRRFHEPALAAALAVSIAPRTIAAAGEVREAQRLRGIDGRWALAALAVPVLERGMEEAVALAQSMDSRGHGRGARTRFRPQAWTWSAGVISALSGGAVAGFLVAGPAGFGDLTPSTYPLEWPGASPLLAGAVLLLSVPSFIGLRK